MTNRLAAIVVVLSWSAGSWHSGRDGAKAPSNRGDGDTPRGPALLFERGTHTFNASEPSPSTEAEAEAESESEFATPLKADDQFSPPAPLWRQSPLLPDRIDLTNPLDDEETSIEFAETFFLGGTSCFTGIGDDFESSDQDEEDWDGFHHLFRPRDEIQADPALLPPKQPGRDGGTTDGGSRASMTTDSGV